ncbi:hypothetical protein TNCV_3597181 [Trichonephila clavipes]|nr:hypothetical protein TNCV_3597181 [Trichonephila clavipes]
MKPKNFALDGIGMKLRKLATYKSFAPQHSIGVSNRILDNRLEENAGENAYIYIYFFFLFSFSHRTVRDDHPGDDEVCISQRSPVPPCQDCTVTPPDSCLAAKSGGSIDSTTFHNPDRMSQPSSRALRLLKQKNREKK